MSQKYTLQYSSKGREVSSALHKRDSDQDKEKGGECVLFDLKTEKERPGLFHSPSTKNMVTGATAPAAWRQDDCSGCTDIRIKF